MIAGTQGNLNQVMTQFYHITIQIMIDLEGRQHTIMIIKYPILTPMRRLVPAMLAI